MIDYDKLYSGGDWSSPAGNSRIRVYSASTEALIGSVPEATRADVDRAVGAARQAFDDPQGWSGRTTSDRMQFMQLFADALGGRGEVVAGLVSSQNGMPISTSLMVEAHASGMLPLMASFAHQADLEVERPRLDGGLTLVRREPVGVVAAIVPWNFPQSISMVKISSALAAGCTVVLKPSPETVLDAYEIAEAAIKAGLPPGVLNILPAGAEVGAYLVSHPGVDKVSFTGSTAAGRTIGAECGRLVRPVTLELGGKSAAIVLDDADLETQLDDFFSATLANNGQTCYLGTRVLAPRSRYAEVVDLVTDLLRSATVGDPLDMATQIGPLVSRKQRDRVEGYIAQGRESGARITTGGGRPKGLDQGWFVEPTLFADVDNSMSIAREEIFGPVLTVISYDNIDDGVRIANDSEYGLAGSVWTADAERGLAVARRIRTGTFGVNGYRADPNSPYGGMKASGLGRECGPDGLAPFQQVKSIYVS